MRGGAAAGRATRGRRERVRWPDLRRGPRILSLRRVLGFALGLALSSACGAPVQLSGSSLQAAGLPLRAFPHVFILRGHLPEEVRIGRGLGEHLERFGHVKAPQLSEEELRTMLEQGPLPLGAVLVEVRLDVRELSHHQFGSPMRTVCDSLDCYVMPSMSAQDVPVLRAILTLTVRDAATMAVRQQVRLRALELSASSDDMLHDATDTLIDRARVLVDHRRLAVQVPMLSEDVPGADDAIDAAEEGRWEEASKRFEALLSRADLSPGERARLLHDLAQTRRFAVDSAEPRAMRASQRAIDRALKLEPTNEALAETRLAVVRDLRNAELLQRQRAAAAHNFAMAAPLD